VIAAVASGPNLYSARVASLNLLSVCWRGRCPLLLSIPTWRQGRACALASKIESMEDCDIRQRYHELVDKRMGGPLTAVERFELACIEIRLDAADRDLDLDTRDREWG
jgi:hypothetical protein